MFASRRQHLVVHAQVGKTRDSNNVLSECKITFDVCHCAFRLHLLAPVMEALQSLIFPFRWSEASVQTIALVSHHVIVEM